MKVRKRKPRIDLPENVQEEIQVVCELFRVEVTAAQAKVFERYIREAVREAFPGRRIRGLWVHKGIGEGTRDR